jgi:hypothetical protein
MLLINMPREILDQIEKKVRKYDDDLLNYALKGLYSEYDNLTRYIQQRDYLFIAKALIQTGVHSCDLVSRMVDIVGNVEGDAREVIRLVVQYQHRLAEYVGKELSRT